MSGAIDCDRRSPARGGRHLHRRRRHAVPVLPGRVARWGYRRVHTVRSLGTATVTVRPQRVRCRDCGVTHILLPTALQARRAHTTEVAGNALAYNAKGMGFRRIDERMDRRSRRCTAGCAAPPMSMCSGCATRQSATDPDRQRGVLCHPVRGEPAVQTLCALSAAAVEDRRRFGFTDPPWDLIGSYTQGRLLSPPRSG